MLSLCDLGTRPLPDRLLARGGGVLRDGRLCRCSTHRGDDDSTPGAGRRDFNAEPGKLRSESRPAWPSPSRAGYRMRPSTAPFALGPDYVARASSNHQPASTARIDSLRVPAPHGFPCAAAAPPPDRDGDDRDARLHRSANPPPRRARAAADLGVGSRGVRWIDWVTAAPPGPLPVPEMATGEGTSRWAARAYHGCGAVWRRCERSRIVRAPMPPPSPTCAPSASEFELACPGSRRSSGGWRWAGRHDVVGR